MHINVTAPLLEIDGKTPLTVEGKGLTFAIVIANALMAPEQNLSGEDQLKRFLLATRIHGATLPVSVSVEEAVLIKKCVAKGYGPLVTGQVWQAIDPATRQQPEAES